MPPRGMRSPSPSAKRISAASGPARSEKLIQIVTNGNNDLERYIDEHFPDAEHTMDVYHVTECIWEAGHCLYKAGSAKLIEWAETQKEVLYDGRAAEIVTEIDKRLAQLDPGKQSARE